MRGVLSRAAPPVKRQALSQMRVGGMLLNVPYHKQLADWSCAIAALQMAAEFHGVGGLDQGVIYGRRKEKSKVAKGQWCVSIQSLAEEANALGFDVKYHRFEFSSIPEMLNQLRDVLGNANSPIIAFQRSKHGVPTGHARVVVGVEDPPADKTMPVVVVHDPATKGVPIGGMNRKWPADQFAAMWKPNLSVAGGEGIWLIPKTVSSSS